MTGTVQLSPVVPSDHVTSRQVGVSLNGTAQPPIEAIANPAQFTCNDGDACIIFCTDINAAGSTSSDGFTCTATLPLNAPTKPQVLGVTFQ